MNLPPKGSDSVDVDHLLASGVTVAGFKPRPIIRKRRKVTVPPTQKDTGYWQKRKKNNDSAKRSREAKKEKEKTFYRRALELECENYFLKERLGQYGAVAGQERKHPLNSVAAGVCLGIEQVNNLREIQAMRRLAPHGNVLELFEVIFEKKSGTLVLICELMDMNIYELIRGKKQFIPENMCKKFMYQLVKSVDHMHRLHPLFPGSNEVDQIAKIHDIMGTPDPSVLNKLKRSRGMNFNFPPKKGSGIERLLTHVSQEAIQLIYQMCTYDPDERITARQALKHHYFKDLRDADKRAAAIAKQRQIQEDKMLEKTSAAETAPTVNGDGDTAQPLLDGTSSRDKAVAEEPREPTKAQLAEITMYPSLPKAQSLPTHAQTLKERKRVGGGGGKSLALSKADVFSSSEIEDGGNTKESTKKKKKVFTRFD
nr:hypothetical protein BaRGS_010394 [Batillaria attramentaria]